MATLLFDLYGVLLKVQDDAALRRVEAATGGDSAIWEAYWDLRYDLDAGLITDEQYWSMFSERTGLQFDVEAARDADYAGWLESDPAMVAKVVALKEAGHTVGILSNIPKELSRRVQQVNGEWLDKLDAVTYSCDLGVAKPNPQAYAMACEALGADPRDVIFLDDNEINVKAARQLGMKARLFTGIGDVDAALADAAESD